MKVDLILNFLLESQLYLWQDDSKERFLQLFANISIASDLASHPRLKDPDKALSSEIGRETTRKKDAALGESRLFRSSLTVDPCFM